jgi:hypothetical protein
VCEITFLDVCGASVDSCTVSEELVNGSGIGGGEEGGVDTMFVATIHLR